MSDTKKLTIDTHCDDNINHADDDSAKCFMCKDVMPNKDYIMCVHCHASFSASLYKANIGLY